jgi:hypothetical protein
VRNTPYGYATSSTVELPSRTFLVDLQITKEGRNPRLTAVLLDSVLDQRAHSKHNDLLLMKMFIKRSREFPLESHVYAHRGRVFMMMNSFTSLTKHLRASRIIELYNSLIIKNLLNF